MNIKKLIILFVATFVAIFVTDFIIHGFLLKSMYMATQNLWRPEEEMHSLMAYMMAGKAVGALFFAWIFIHGYKGTGVGEGVRYGLLMAGFTAGCHLMMYSVQPYPMELILAWIGAGVVQYVAVGALCACVWGCKRGEAQAS